MRELLTTRDAGFSLEELTEIFDVKRATALDDLRHLHMSLRHRPESLLVVPPQCGTCSFVFRIEEPRAPGRCPRCKSAKVVDPVFKVARAEA